MAFPAAGLTFWFAWGFPETSTANQVVVGSVGAAAGVLIGLNRGQTVQNARLVAEHGDQQETLGFLLQLLRHDTQNDLTTISWYVDLLEDHVEGETGREHLARIQRRTESMRELFRTAGTILESETGRRSTEVVDLTRVLRDKIDHVGAIDGATIETDLEADLEVAVDPLVDELFRNVFDNAIAHNPVDGLTILMSSRADGDEAVVEVADDGEGIPADIREDVFDLDVRRPDSEGDGLGLYLVRKLVDSYGGPISVSETEPSGTRFTVRLPRS